MNHSGEWDVQISRTNGKKYYYNHITGESQWEKPPNISLQDTDIKMVHILHILLKHTKSRNPITAKGDSVHRSKEEALQQVLLLRSQISSVDDFKRLATEYSECSSAKRGGDLGLFGPRTMHKQFEDVAYSGLLDFP